MDTSDPEKTDAATEEIPGPGGDSIAVWLLTALAAFGPEVFAVIRDALRRHATNKTPVLSLGWLLNDAEREELTEAVATVLTPSQMIGRLRLHGAAGELSLSDFGRIARLAAPGRPEFAVNYFRRLFPALGSFPRLGGQIRRLAFTVAVSTERALTAAVQREITQELASGVPSQKAVERLMDDFGTLPRHKSYVDMLVRTNVMDALNQGQRDELERPGMKALFPVWQYHAIRDERVRPWHRSRDGRYWPINVLFEDVRGRDPVNFCNCRCNWTPITRRVWERLRSQGEMVEGIPQNAIAG